MISVSRQDEGTIILTSSEDIGFFQDYEDDDIRNIFNLKHYEWKVDWAFYGVRNRKDTPTGKPYGSDLELSALYEDLCATYNGGESFIDRYFTDIFPGMFGERADAVLSKFYERAEAEIEKRQEKDFIKNAPKNRELYSKAYTASLDDFDKARENYERWSETLYDANTELLNAVSNLNEAEYLYNNFEGKKTKYGVPDIRYKEGKAVWKEYSNALRACDAAIEKVRKAETQKKRFDTMLFNIEDKQRGYVKSEDANSQENEDVARSRVEELEGKISELAKDFCNDAYVESEGSALASEVRDDIISKLACGVLPLQKASLAPRTIKKRRSVGIDSTSVFYATGQLIEGLTVLFNFKERSQ